MFLLAFIAFGVWLAFRSGGVWVTEDGAPTAAIGMRILVLIFFSVFPLFLILWILFPKAFNKLLYKAVNKGVRSGARMMEYKERCEDQNVPDITVNGVNFRTVAAAAHMIGDAVSGEELPEQTAADDVPQICEECGTVLAAGARFCTNCGTERKS